MSYIDAIYDRKNNKVKTVERVNGARVYRETDFEHVLYYEHPAGSKNSIFDNPCKEFKTRDTKKFRKKQMELADAGIKVFESDINEVFRHLSNEYTGVDAPKLNLCFFDIEADFDAERGFAPTHDPFCAVTAISVYLTHMSRLITLVLAPPTISPSDADEMVKPVYTGGNLVSGFEDTIVFDNEIDMLDAFLTLIEDADVLSGWNSEFYDIPYLVNRIKRLMGDSAAKRMCLWGYGPREREYTKFGKLTKTYELVGRVHLDYLLLYQKHNTKQQLSYRLDFIGEIEVGENKIPYEGTLDDLYKKDFYRFVEYNRQDVMILVKIDERRKFIELANQIAHANCVLLKTTVGSVSLVEQAIINEMHAMGFVVPNRRPKQDQHPDDVEERTPVVGAYVAKPKQGIHYEVACVDINSLYPSAIRSLNMSPETIFGQIRSTQTMGFVEQRIKNGTDRALAWEGIFRTLEVSHMMAEEDYTMAFEDGMEVPISGETMLEVDFEDGRFITVRASDLKNYVFNPANSVCISANGTIFRTDKVGIIPTLLEKWYSERKSMQAQEKMYAQMAEGIEIDKELASLLGS